MRKQGFFFQLMSAILAGSATVNQKQVAATSLNKQTGGMLFSNGPIPGRLPNQRQIRKLNRQTKNYRRLA